MNHFMGGFASELEKTAVVGKALWGLVKRHPWTLGLSGATTLASTYVAGKRGYESGLRGGETGRYLPQRVVGGYAIPTPTAYRNYNRELKPQARKGKTSPTRLASKGALTRRNAPRVEREKASPKRKMKNYSKEKVLA